MPEHEAPYGYKLDGTPRKRRGRPPKRGDPDLAPRNGDLLLTITRDMDKALGVADSRIERYRTLLQEAEADRARIATARDAVDEQLSP